LELGLFKNSLFIDDLLVGVPKETLDPVEGDGFDLTPKGEKDGLFKYSLFVDDLLVGVPKERLGPIGEV